MKSRKFDESDFTSREVQENALVELDNNGKEISSKKRLGSTK